MKGTKQKINNNTWRLRYCYNGTRYSKNVEATTVKEANLLLAEFILDIEKNTYLNNTNYTFYEYSLIWLKEKVKPNCSPITMAKDISYLNNRVLPVLGKYKLSDINPLILSNFFNSLKKEKTMYKNREPKYLSKSTIIKIMDLVSRIMNYAYIMDIIPSNPVTKARKNINLNDIPSEINKKEKIYFWDKETYKYALECMKKEPFLRRAIYEITIKTGMRASELYALTKEDIDLNAKTISITKSRHYVKESKSYVLRPPKTNKSRRLITIPPSLIPILKELISNSKNEYLFDEYSKLGLGAAFLKFQKKYNISPIINFHGMRHTHATLLLAQGVDIKTISERLGHEDIRVTMNTYTDVLDELQFKAAKAIDEI